MRAFLVVVTVSVLSLNVAAGEEFAAFIKKVENNKVTLTKMPATSLGDPKTQLPTDLILTASDSCKVLKGGTRKNDTPMGGGLVAPGYIPKFEGGEPVEDGLKSSLFKKATVQAVVETTDGKITLIRVLRSVPSNEVRGLIKKVEGKSVTFMKFSVDGSPAKETTLKIAENVKVLKGKFNPRAGSFSALEAVKDGLENEMFTKGNFQAVLVTNDDNQVTEIRVVDNSPPAAPPPSEKK